MKKTNYKTTIYYSKPPSKNNTIVKTDRNGHARFIQYNTGDKVWFRWEGQKEIYGGGTSKVIKIKTHDDLLWIEGMSRIISIKGVWYSLIPVFVLVLMIAGIVVRSVWF